MKSMREMISLMEGVMAVPGLSRLKETEAEMQTAATAAQDQGADDFDATQVEEEAQVVSCNQDNPDNAAEACAMEESMYDMDFDPMGGDKVADAIKMFKDLTDNFVEPEEAMDVVMRRFDEAGATPEEQEEIGNAIMDQFGSEDNSEPMGVDDFSDDAEALASAGHGSDEDYGYASEVDEAGQRAEKIDSTVVNQMAGMPHDIAKETALDILANTNTSDQKKQYLANQINNTRNSMAVVKLMYDMILKGEGNGVQGSSYSKKFDKPMEEDAMDEYQFDEDIQNGYNNVEVADGNDYFPNGADGPVVSATGPSGARQGDNPEQKKMQIAEVHKELVYGYRNYLKETK